MHQGGEPSLEEILASIQKVMAREEPGSEPSNIDRIEPAHEEEAADILDLAEEDMLLPEDGGVHVPHQDTEQLPDSRDVTPAGAGRTMSGGDAANAIRDSLAALERLSRTNPSPSGLNDSSLQATTRAMLRPMLEEWLEANLPAIVERLVQAEIARIVDRNAS